MSKLFDQISGAKPDAAAAASPDHSLRDAWQKALAGDLAGAETLLTPGGRLPADPVALDLLARIAEQSGRTAQARSLWRAALRLAPGFGLAKNSMTLPEPSSAAGVGLRRVALLAVLLLLGGLLLGGGYLLGSWFSGRPNAAPYSAELSRAGLPATGPDETGAAQLPSGKLTVPRLAVRGFSIRAQAGALTLQFDEPPFLYQDILSAAAKEEVAAFAQATQAYLGTHRILIEGRPDSERSPAGNRYRNTYALGLQRAAAIARMLQMECHLPAQALLVAALDPSGHDRADARQMVVLKLVPRASGP